ncbi:hypothetical protein, partial [Phenylobacterium sp.]|uniref:hypothetical protein n=1 Tax=Phenylobacterium sp. TaxID=1871053 RepID=UPI0025F00816
QDVHHRIGETDVLVAMTTEDGVAAQAVGMKALEDVLEFFLGSVEHTDVRIRTVNRIDGDELTVADVDPAALAVALETNEAQSYRRQVSAERERERNPVSFVAANGQRLQIDFALEHIVSLSHKVTAVLRVEPTISYAATGEIIPARRFSRLPDEDMLAIDRATLAFAALFTPMDARSQPPVIVPVSFRTMGARKGRHLLMNVEGVTPERVRQGVMLEFVDIDRGTPTGRMVEVVSLVGRLTRGVLARLQPGRDSLHPVQGARFNGLTLDFADVALPISKVEDLMRTMAHQMRGKAPALIAQGLDGFAHMDLADKAGFTHASMRSPPITQLSRDVA